MITRPEITKAGALLAVTVAMAAAMPLPCQADELAPRQMRVTYADLDLSTVQGAGHLYGRIERSAYYVCGTSATDTEVIMHAPGPCVGAAIAHAVQHINNPKLTQVYVSKYGTKVASSYGISSDTLTAHD